MAKKINNFWSRFCGLCVGIFSAMFGTNRAFAVDDYYCSLTANGHYIQTCGEQGFDGGVTLDGRVIPASQEQTMGSGKVYSSYDSTIDTGMTCVINEETNDAVELIGSCNYYEFLNKYMPGKTYSTLCNGTLGCILRDIGGDSAGLGVSVINGMVGFSGKSFKRVAYACINDNIHIIANCYDNIFALYGCGSGVDADGNIISSGAITVNAANRIVNTSGKTIYTIGSALVSSEVTDSIGSLSNLFTNSGYSCKSCNVPDGVSASRVHYSSPIAGQTWNSEKCYFTTSTSESNSDKFTDCTGTFYYPMSSGEICDCWYNRGTDGLANCS